MTNENLWHVLFVDDDPVDCQLVANYLNGQVVTDPDGKLKVDTEVDFDEGLHKLESTRYDLVILDVRLGPREEEREEEAGITTLESIKDRRFVPVIFYTALPKKVRDLETPLIRIVEKTEGVPRLLSTIKEIFSTKLPFVNRVLLQHLEEVQRDYMWEFVANNWENFGDTPDRTSLAYLLARRLAKSLDSPGIQKLAEKLGDSTGIWFSEDNVHPMRYYVMPTVGVRPMSGDIVREEDGGQTRYMVLITPSCDLVQKKVDLMLFARCSLLRERQEFVDWKNNPDDPKGKYKGRLWELLKNSASERFFFLPGVFDLPDLIVDYQQLITIEPGEFDRLEGEGRFKCIASLDIPFSEVLVARFARYFGRLGIPDLNVNIVIEKLKREIRKDSQMESK